MKNLNLYTILCITLIASSSLEAASLVRRAAQAMAPKTLIKPALWVAQTSFYKKHPWLCKTAGVIIAGMAVKKVYPYAKKHYALYKQNRSKLLQEEFLQAAARGDSQGITRLLRKGVSVNSRDDQDTTALMHAVAHASCVELLLQNGALFDIKNKAGETALSKAIALGNCPAIQALVEAGATFNPQQVYDHKKCQDIWRAIHEASDKLDERDKKTDEATRTLWKALRASRESDQSYIQAIKKALHGADLAAKNRYGQNALTLAAIYDAENIKRIQLFPAENAILGNDTYRQFSEIISELMIKKAHIDYDELNKLPYSVIIKIVIQDAQNKARKIATDLLIDAISANNFDKIDHIILSRPCLEINDLQADFTSLGQLAYRDDGQTPLMLAASQNNKEIVIKLLKAGARPDIKNKNGESALSKAIAHKQYDIIRILLQHGAPIPTIQTVRELLPDDSDGQSKVLESFEAYRRENRAAGQTESKRRAAARGEA